MKMKRAWASPTPDCKRGGAGAPAGPQRRERIVLGDLADCLMQAYECVARRAYEIFLERGAVPGRELDDWLEAERQILAPVAVDFEESEEYVHALASAPCFEGAEVEISIEPHWLAILAGNSPADGFADRASGAPGDSGGAAQGQEASKDAAGSGEMRPGGTNSDAEELFGARGEDCYMAQAFCIVQLPAEVVPKSCVAILGDGVVGIRMPKAAKARKPAAAETVESFATR
jgi:HSP20 family molecular chaperone IbpA